MNWRLCVFLTFFGSSVYVVTSQKKSCPTPRLNNGRVRLRGNGRMAYFRCKKNFQIVGQKLAVCLTSGTWSQQTPVCVGTGCPDLGALPDVTIREHNSGGILEFECAPGMRREGPQRLLCLGRNWDNSPPKCSFGISAGCDFEDRGLCGWTQDANDDFDWTWTQGGTPTSETGPDGDHTTGSGHYIFMESSAPQKSGQVTRLISPPYQPMSKLCLNFFYHMKGPAKPGDVGDLDVFIRTESDSDAGYNDQPLFHVTGSQGDDWRQAKMPIPTQRVSFKIVFAATRRESWTGDIALDDIRVVFNCSDELTTVTVVPSRQTTPSLATVTSRTKPTASIATGTTKTILKTNKTTPTSMPSSTAKPPAPTTRSTLVPKTNAQSTTPPSTSTPTTITTSSTTMTTTTQTTAEKPTSTVSVEVTEVAQVTSFPDDSEFESITTIGPDSSKTEQHLETNDVYTFVNEDEVSFSLTVRSSPTLAFSISTDSSGWEPTEKPDHEDYGDALDPHDENYDSSEQPREGNVLTSGNKPPPSDYLPLIVGVTLGLAVGMAVIGILAWMWARNRRKLKERQVEEDQMNIIGSIEGNPYHH